MLKSNLLQLIHQELRLLPVQEQREGIRPQALGQSTQIRGGVKVELSLFETRAKDSGYEGGDELSSPLWTHGTHQ